MGGCPLFEKYFLPVSFGVCISKILISSNLESWLEIELSIREHRRKLKFCKRAMAPVKILSLALLWSQTDAFTGQHSTLWLKHTNTRNKTPTAAAAKSWSPWESAPSATTSASDNNAVESASSKSFLSSAAPAVAPVAVVAAVPPSTEVKAVPTLESGKSKGQSYAPFGGDWKSSSPSAAPASAPAMVAAAVPPLTGVNTAPEVKIVTPEGQTYSPFGGETSSTSTAAPAAPAVVAPPPQH